MDKVLATQKVKSEITDFKLFRSTGKVPLLKKTISLMTRNKD